MRIRRGIAISTLLLSVTAALAATDVTGEWRTALPGRKANPRPFVFELVQAADGGVSGKVVGFRSEGAIRDGRVDGNSIRFSAENQYQARSVLMTFHGTVTGDVMELIVEFADNDEKLEIEAKREK